MASLSKEEYQRYNRHIILPEIKEEGQLKLKNAKVLVIGAGGLGCPVLQYLTAAGVGRIGIIDADSVDISNLQRQVLFKTSDVGKSKAQTAADLLKEINPLLQFDVYQTWLNKENAIDILTPYDIVVDCTDNFPTRYLVNDACVITGKPLVFGAIFKFDGQVSVFNYKEGPTYRCLFPNPPAPGEVPSCSEIGVIGVLPGIIGTLQANEVIKMITGVGEVLSGKFLTFDALTMMQTAFKFKKVEANTKIDSFTDYQAFCGITTEPQSDEITVEELAEWLAENPDLQLVDVREDYEHEDYNIGGINIPLSELEDRYSEIDTSKKAVLYCQKGGRSMKALTFLKEQFPANTELYSVMGGVDEIIESGEFE